MMPSRHTTNSGCTKDFFALNLTCKIHELKLDVLPLYFKHFPPSRLPGSHDRGLIDTLFVEDKII